MTEELALPTQADLIASGDQAVRDGDLPLARRRYEEANRLDPSDLDSEAGLDYVTHLESGRASRYDFAPEAVGSASNKDKERNIEILEEDFEAGRTLLRSRPSRGFIEHTTRCNFYCPHCSKGYEAYHAEDMSEDFVNKSLDTLLPTMTWACITGFGEPTIGSTYTDVMRRLVDNGVRPHFNTNVSTLTIPHIEQLVKSEAQITLSIDGATKETFETIRAGGSWEKTQKSLHALKRVRTILGGNSWFDITYVAMRLNIHELPDMIRLADRFNLDLLRVQDYHYHNIEFDNQSLRHEPDKANRYIEEAVALAKEVGLQLLVPPPYTGGAPPPQAGLFSKVLKSRRLLPKRNRIPQRCKAPWQEANIKVDGNVTPCCFSMTMMGNLKRKKFESIWNGFRYRFFRWRIQTPVPPLECRWCHVIEGINKGNPNNVLMDEGLLLKVFYFVEYKISAFRQKRGEAKLTKNYFRGKWLRPGKNDGEESASGPAPG